MLRLITRYSHLIHNANTARICARGIQAISDGESRETSDVHANAINVR